MVSIQDCKWLKPRDVTSIWFVCLFIWSLTSPFVTVMDISATDRNPEPGDNPLLFSTDSKGSFRYTQPQTVMHTTKPLLNQLGTTSICPHCSNQSTQDSNPGPSDHESQSLCVSPPNEDSPVYGVYNALFRQDVTLSEAQINKYLWFIILQLLSSWLVTY